VQVGEFSEKKNADCAVADTFVGVGYVFDIDDRILESVLVNVAYLYLRISIDDVHSEHSLKIGDGHGGLPADLANGQVPLIEFLPRKHFGPERFEFEEGHFIN
jgi:hypothetical protein